MPIYEYLCTPCNRIYSFLSMTASPARQPTCPRCGATELERVPSVFAVHSSKKSEKKGKDEEGGKTQPEGGREAGGPDEASMARLEHEAMQMMDGLDEKDAENPRVMARMMRRLADASGEKITPGMDEMFRRMEAGEDPEALEEELGPQLEEEMGEAGGGAGMPTRDEGLYDF